MSKEEIKGMFWLNASRFCDALEDGREVVVIAGQENYDSAIMWLSGDYKTRYAFAKEIGTCEQPYDRERTEDHFCTILAEGGLLVARGAARRGYGFCD